jgi:hypothetical protein
VSDSRTLLPDEPKYAGLSEVNPVVTPNSIEPLRNAIITNTEGLDLKLTSWGDGSGVPTSGNNLVIIGIDNYGLLHIRIFDARGNRVKDTDQAKLPATQAKAISELKQELPDLLPPHVLTPTESAEVLSQATSIVGQTYTDPRVLAMAALVYGLLGQSNPDAVQLDVIDVLKTTMSKKTYPIISIRRVHLHSPDWAWPGGTGPRRKRSSWCGTSTNEGTKATIHIIDGLPRTSWGNFGRSIPDHPQAQTLAN